MYDIVVIGGGPAGMTTALYAARAGKKVMMLEESAFGGQIAIAPRVENFPSVGEIVGAQLAERMFEQVTAHGVDFDMGHGIVSRVADGFQVTTEYGEFHCKAVVLATGVSHKKLDVPGEKELSGNGVCYCAVCDGAFYKNKSVTVVGDGNSAAQYALYLAEICDEVQLLTLFDKLFCDKDLQQRIVSSSKIVWTKNVTVTEIVGKEQVQGIAFRDTDGAITYADTDAVFVAIGQEPHNQDFAGLVALDDKGYIVAGEDCATSCQGIFVAGDCRTKSVRQCTTAVGDGAVAGFNAAMYVDKVKQ